MHSLQSLAVLLAVAPFSAAAPAGSSFTLQQEPTGNFKLRNGFLAIQQTYEKYGRPVPGYIQKAAAAMKQSGHVPTFPEKYDEAYLTPVHVGTPGQKLMLDFDTGSSDLWVFSTELPANESQGHILYNASASSTSSQMKGSTWKIGYADGSGANGNVYSDKVHIGRVTVTSQAVEAAVSVSSSFASNTANDGLLGLAFSQLNTVQPKKVPTFFDNVKSSLKQPLFAAYLRKGEPGSYDFGFIDKTKYTGSLAYVAVNSSRGFWEFNSPGFSVGSKKIYEKLDMVADTGTSIMYLPKQVISSYYAEVKGAKLFEGVYVFPCTAKLPSLSIIINGQLRNVPGDYLNYAPISGKDCLGGLQSSSGFGINILGDVFLKSQYVVFDGGNNRIGFGQQA